MSYYDFVKDYMKVDECKNNEKYSSAGHTFCWKKENSTYAEGLYWFYEGGSFIIDIHDFYIREEVVQNSTYSMADYVSIYTSYIVSANGEKFSPYQTLTANSLCTFDFDNIRDDFLFLLHENSYYLCVSIGFKRELLEKHLSSININPESFYGALLQTNQIILTKALERVAMEILNCKMDAPAADFFFKAKANEWISIVIDTYLNRKKI
ncbi:AraC family transcriptional regulator [Streptococcus pneumoniae]|nr:AraC family transcriptional regulator [Streptococcus pneumoniae]